MDDPTRKYITPSRSAVQVPDTIWSRLTTASVDIFACVLALCPRPMASSKSAVTMQTFEVRRVNSAARD